MKRQLYKIRKLHLTAWNTFHCSELLIDTKIILGTGNGGRLKQYMTTFIHLFITFSCIHPSIQLSFMFSPVVVLGMAYTLVKKGAIRFSFMEAKI